MLKAGVAVVLIGERLGLSAPDSLGPYFTYDPKPGRADSERKCVSSIRPPGGSPTTWPAAPSRPSSSLADTPLWWRDPLAPFLLRVGTEIVLAQRRRSDRRGP